MRKESVLKSKAILLFEWQDERRKLKTMCVFVRNKEEKSASLSVVILFPCSRLCEFWCRSISRF